MILLDITIAFFFQKLFQEFSEKFRYSFKFFVKHFSKNNSMNSNEKFNRDYFRKLSKNLIPLEILEGLIPGFPSDVFVWFLSGSSRNFYVDSSRNSFRISTRIPLAIYAGILLGKYWDISTEIFLRDICWILKVSFIEAFLYISPRDFQKYDHWFFQKYLCGNRAGNKTNVLPRIFLKLSQNIYLGFPRMFLRFLKKILFWFLPAYHLDLFRSNTPSILPRIHPKNLQESD